MSQENVELTRQAYEAWNDGDLDWMLDHMTDDFEFRPGLGFSDLNAVSAARMAGGGSRRFGARRGRTSRSGSSGSRTWMTASSPC